MKIEITTLTDGVLVAAIEHGITGASEVVMVKGATLTEALENLMMRFGELRVATLQGLRRLGFVRTESTEDLS